METAVAIHRFEAAGLGKAPFRCIGMTEEKFVPAPGVPARPGSSCDYCGQAIMSVFHIRSADGKRFKVGCDCVLKVGDAGLKLQVNTLKRDAQHKRDDARIEAAYELLDSRKDVRDALAGVSLGNRGLLLNYVQWCRLNAGRTGKLACARDIEKAAAGQIPFQPSRQKLRPAPTSAARG